MVISLTLRSQPHRLIAGADPHAQPWAPGAPSGTPGVVDVPRGPENENEKGRTEEWEGPGVRGGLTNSHADDRGDVKPPRLRKLKFRPPDCVLRGWVGGHWMGPAQSDQVCSWPAASRSLRCPWSRECSRRALALALGPNGQAEG